MKVSTLGVFVALSIFSSLLHAQGSGYHIIDTLLLGDEGGWDYLTIDTDAHRLYATRTIRVVAIDLETLSIIGELGPTRGIHGVAVVKDAGKGFTSNGRDSSVTIFDLKTLKQLTRLHINARDPDAILYEPTSKRVFTFNGGSSTATAINPRRNAVAGTVILKGKPEAAVADRGRIYVNLEDKNQIAVIDPRTLKILSRWSISPGEGPTGLAIDRKRHRLFSVCANKRMVILDQTTGRVVSSVPIGEGADGVVVDEEAGLAFSSNGEGTVTVVREESPKSYSVIDTFPTRKGARTIALDPSTHRLYTIAGKFGPMPPPTQDQPRPRPPILPLTVTLYVIGK